MISKATTTEAMIPASVVKFCGKPGDDGKFILSRPCVDAGQIMATDGKHAICYDNATNPEGAVADAKPDRFPPIAPFVTLARSGSVLVADLSVAAFRAALDAEAPEMPGYAECETCHGTGKVDCECSVCGHCRKDKCNDCAGKGKSEVKIATRGKALVDLTVTPKGAIEFTKAGEYLDYRSHKAAAPGSVMRAQAQFCGDVVDALRDLAVEKVDVWIAGPNKDMLALTWPTGIVAIMSVLVA